MSNDPNHMQAMLTKLRAYARRKSLTVNTPKFASTLTPAICPLSFMMARSSPIQTPQNIWAWFVTGMSIWILLLMQRYVHSQLVLSASNSSFGNMTLLTGYTSTCGSLKCTQFLLVCKPGLGPPILTTKQRIGQFFTKMAGDGAQEDNDGQGTTPSWCVMHECSLEPIQFN